MRHGRYVPHIVVILLAAGVYANTLNHGFVWDDIFSILSNPWIKDISFLPDMFFTHSLAWDPSVPPSRQYNPIKLVQLAMLYAVSGRNPLGYHAAAVILHAFASLMVFLLARAVINLSRAGVSPGFPLAAAALFAVHPVHTEVVNWVSGLPELTMSLFCLISLYLYLTSEGQGYRLFASAFFLLLAMLTKITALSIVPLYLLIDYMTGAGWFGVYRSTGDRISATLKRYASFILASCCALGLFIYATGGAVPLEGQLSIGAKELVLTIPVLFSDYLKLLIYPWPLSALYTFHPITSPWDIDFIIGSALMAATVILAVLARRNRFFLFSGALLLLPLVPSLLIPAVGYAFYPFAERYLYLPSAGFCLMCSLGLRAFCEQIAPGKIQRTIVSGAGIILLVVLSTLTVLRNPVWRNELTLWSDTIAKSPDNAVAHNNLGCAYEKWGETDRALGEYEEALRLDPSYGSAADNRFRLLQSRQDR